MKNLFKFKENVDLSGYTLFIPSVSVGNVPQLTVDLLITTFNMKKIATIWHPAIISSVGGDPYESNTSEICTACELYIIEDLKIAAIQLRSTLNFRLVTKFFADLKIALTEFKLGHIILLTSAFDYEMHVINMNKFFYISNNNMDGIMEKYGVKVVEPLLSGKYNINGAGFVVKLYEYLCTDLKCTLLVKNVSEGDNIPDAMQTCNILMKVLNFDCKYLEKVKIPTSWEHVFGGPPPVGMY